MRVDTIETAARLLRMPSQEKTAARPGLGLAPGGYAGLHGNLFWI